MKKTQCDFAGGVMDGKAIPVAAEISKMSIPSIQGGRFDSHVYVRTGATSFRLELIELGSPTDLEEVRYRNLDYVFGLRDRVAELEAESATLRKQIAGLEERR